MVTARLARLRLLLWDLLFFGLEAGAVLGVLDAYLLCPPRLLYAGMLLLSTAALLGQALDRRQRAPLIDAAQRLPAALPAALREPAYQAAVTLPFQTLLRRTGLLCVAALLTGALGVVRFGQPADIVPLCLFSAALCTPLLDTFRALLYEHELQGLLRRLDVEVAPLRRLRDRYRGQLVLASLGTAAPAMLAALGFALFFVPLSPEQHRRVLTLFPPVPLLMMAAWAAWLRRLTRPLDRYLAQVLREGAEARAAADAAAGAAYVAAQLLPYRLGASKVVLWVVGALLLGVAGHRLLGVEPENAALLLGEVLLITLGAALYEVLWHRSTLAPLLTDLAVRRHGDPLLRNPLSLRTKMLVAFGTLTLFACGLSLFFSVMQYRTVAGRYVQRLNDLHLSDLIAELRAQPQLEPPALHAFLRKSSRRDLFIYHLPPLASRGLGFAGTAVAPPLPESAWAALRDRRAGALDLPAPRLQLSYAHVPGRPELGTLLLARPGDGGGDLDLETRVLIAFFVFLLLGSLGVVVLAATELTRPIRELWQRAEVIARGDLDRPRLPVAVEADEVGRLCVAFEEMRRALSERFRSSTEINYALEAQVARRTKELERRNRELQDTLSALQAAQEELLHAEKMASMGRLVAGIAHEINNPVNAVVNTAGPLQETIAELRELIEPAPPARAGLDDALRQSLASATAEMRAMLRVIQRGARRTKEIVQALHNYSRGDEGLPGAVDLHRCLDESLDLLQHDLKSGITVARDYGALDPVSGHAGQVQQVFMNLLTNAVQALGGGSAQPGAEIRITTQMRDGRALVTIADNGPGIPRDALPRIFDPFFTTKEVGQGSGLGLSIVHGIVARHGGTITVDSEVGRGTRMTVTLPVQ